MDELLITEETGAVEPPAENETHISVAGETGSGSVLPGEGAEDDSAVWEDSEPQDSAEDTPAGADAAEDDSADAWTNAETENTPADAATAGENAPVLTEKDVLDFVRQFPEVKAEEIPQAVWEQVLQGRRLADAWAEHENSALRQQLQQAKQKLAQLENAARNAARSTGSAVSAGRGSKSAFDEAWDAWES